MTIEDDGHSRFRCCAQPVFLCLLSHSSPQSCRLEFWGVGNPYGAGVCPTIITSLHGRELHVPHPSRDVWLTYSITRYHHPVGHFLDLARHPSPPRMQDRQEGKRASVPCSGWVKMCGGEWTTMPLRQHDWLR